MSVDTEQQHYECTKCHDVVSIRDYLKSKNNKCSKGGRCDWKKNQTSFNKSALGATINLGVGLAKWGVDKAKSKTDKDSSENQEGNNAKSDSLSEERKQLKAEKEARSAEENKKIMAFLKKYWWIVLVLVGLLGARIIYLRMKNKAPENIEVVSQPTENNTPSAEKNNVETPIQENTTTESTNTLPASTVNFEGTWKGAFGKDELTIVIESIDANGVVKGYDEVKGNRRILKGTLVETENGNQITVTEPGDDKWDGEFKMTYDKSSQIFIGEWNSNNGKSRKEFKLSKN